MPEYQPGSQPEIDLLYVLRPVSRFLKRLWHAILYYFRALGRNFLLFLLIFGLFFVAGRFLNHIFKPGFQVRAIIVSHTLSGAIMAGMIGDISHPNIELQKNLKLSHEMAQTIIKIDADSMRIRLNRRSMDSVLYFNVSDSLIYGVTVTMLMSDMRFLDTIQKSLVTYLGSSPFAAHRNQARKTSLVKLRDQLKQKTDRLDSVQNLINNSILNHRESGNGEALNPVDGYRAAMIYLKQQISIDQELSILDDIEILKPFNNPTYFNFPDYSGYYFNTLLIGLGVALVLAPLLGRKPKPVVNAR